MDILSNFETLSKSQLWRRIKNYPDHTLSWRTPKNEMITFLQQNPTPRDLTRKEELSHEKKNILWSNIKSNFPNYSQQNISWRTSKDDMIDFIVFSESLDEINLDINILIQELENIPNTKDKIFHIFNYYIKEFLNSLEEELSEQSHFEKEFISSLEELLLTLIQDDKYLIKVTYNDGVADRVKIYVLSGEFIISIINRLIENTIVELTEEQGSDSEISMILLQNEIVSFEIEKMENVKQTEGKFFNYYHNLDGYDLTDLQIYRNEQEMKDNYNEHCLINSLMVLGMDDDKIDRIKSYFGINCINDYINSKKLGELCNEMDIYIIIKPFKDTEDELCTGYKLIHRGDKKSKEKYELLMYKDHYLPKIKLPCTTYSIYNHEDVQNEVDFRKINGTETRNGEICYRRINRKTCSSKILIALVRSGKLYFDSSISKYHNIGEEKDKSKIYLDNIEDEQDIIDINCGEVFTPLIKKINEVIRNNPNDFKSNPKYIKLTDLTQETIDIGKTTNPDELDVKETQISFLSENNIHITPKVKKVNILCADCEAVVVNEDGDNIDHKSFMYGVKQFNSGTTLVLKDFKDFLNMIIYETINTKTIDKIHDLDIKIKGIHKQLKVLKGIKKHNAQLDLEDYEEEKMSIVNKFLSKKDIDWVPFEGNHRIVYFHNLKYDFTLFKNSDDIVYKNICKKDGTIYSVLIMYKGYYVEFRDSFKLISTKLSCFKDMFNLDVGKMEDFNVYDLYTKEVIEKDYIKSTERGLYKKFKNCLPRDIFVKYLVINENPREKATKSFMHIKLYEDYLSLDCDTLEQGLYEMEKIIMEITGLSIFDFLTISSLGFANLTINGCFDGLYHVKGHLRSFIMESVIGGRVCLRDNEKIMVNGEIVDFDAVSLYPSAMKKSELPLGKCKNLGNNLLGMLDDNKLLILNDYDHYIVECVFDIDKERQLPGFSFKDKDGNRIWTNEFPVNTEIGVNGEVTPFTVVIDKITLEDLLKYHEIYDIKIIRGVYYDTKPEDSGFNDKIQNVISQMFEARLDAKKNSNIPLSNCLKLLMNSSYGKTLIKPSKTNMLLKSNVEFVEYGKNKGKKNLQNYYKNYINNHYHNIEEIEIINNKSVLIKEKNIIHNHYNLCQVGGIILSNSKKIMHEVLGTADDNNMNLYYTDTDSIHMDKKDIEELSKKFKSKYNCELIGKNMGQFHSDFEHKDLRDPWSIKFIGLGKKCYLDILTDKSGKTGYHVRFKGASRTNLENYCEEIEKRTGVRFSLEELYESLLIGDEHTIDLCKGKVRFEFGNNYVRTKSKFLRKYKF